MADVVSGTIYADRRGNMKKRIGSLDGMRVVMVWIIIISHFSFLKDWEGWKYILAPNLAVDYFFLLSGLGLYVCNNDEIGGGITTINRLCMEKDSKIISRIYTFTSCEYSPHAAIKNSHLWNDKGWRDNGG